MIQRPDEQAEENGKPNILAHLEALLFVAGEPISLKRLADIMDAPGDEVRAGLEQLKVRYQGPAHGVHLVEIAGGWRLLTNPECADTVEALAGRRSVDRLSPAALETLAIVAYRQPVSRAEVERVRGVGVGPILRHLMELDLLKVAGREPGLGRALLYGTTRSFLDRFGLKNIRDLPASLEV